MERASMQGLELLYEEAGSGEPVLLIHGGLFADTFAPLMQEAALRPYRLIRYRRRGLGGSSRPAQPGTMADQAQDAVALLDCLGVDCAHLVGHSLGASLALQVACDAPERVATLSLLEPGLPDALTNEETLAYVAACAQLLETDPAAAVERFFTLVLGNDARDVLDRNVPGAFDQGVADAELLFADEFAALSTWSFGPEQARTVTQPALFVLGSESDATILETLADPWFAVARDRLQELLPQLETIVLDGVNHQLQVADPTAVAVAVGDFLGRHALIPS